MTLRERLLYLERRWGLYHNRRSVLLLFACSILPASVLLWVSHHQAINKAYQELEQAIEIAVQQTDSLLSDADLMLRRLAADIDDPHSATAQSLLLRAVYTDIRFRGAGIVNSDGAIVVTSFGRVDPPKPVPGGVLFDRARDGLQIIGPVRELIMQETSVALAMNGPRGRVFYLLVDPGLLTYFLEILPDLELGPHGAVGFVTDDGHLLSGAGDRGRLRRLAEPPKKDRIHVRRSTAGGRIHVVGEMRRDWALHDWYAILLFGVPLSITTSLVLIIIFLRRTHSVGDLDHDIRIALMEDELQVRYQPIVELRTGRCVGSETLLRWQHPTQGLVLPGLFIPRAEKTGIIVELTDWLIERVVREQAAIADASGGALYTSINLSCAQLNKGKIDGLLKGIDRMTQRIPNHLILEITESESINNGNTTLLESIERLRRHGALFAIDDFGTGYSSLAYLNRLHIDYMKIDRHFLQGIDQPDASTAVLEGVISLGKRLALTMVAEGVETSAQRDILVAAGVQYGQGWLFSHPLTLAEYVDFLRSRAAEGSFIGHQPRDTTAVSIGARSTRQA